MKLTNKNLWRGGTLVHPLQYKGRRRRIWRRGCSCTTRRPWSPLVCQGTGRRSTPSPSPNTIVAPLRGVSRLSLPSMRRIHRQRSPYRDSVAFCRTATPATSRKAFVRRWVISNNLGFALSSVDSDDELIEHTFLPAIV